MSINVGDPTHEQLKLSHINHSQKSNRDQPEIRYKKGLNYNTDQHTPSSLANPAKNHP